MKVAVVVQARTSSTRLPGKVLLPLAGKPLLQRQLERISRAKTRFELCVATTAADGDAPIRTLCDEIGVKVFAGHPVDLIDRHYRAGLWLGADVVVKIPSDCPLIDPDAIDRVLSAATVLESDADLLTNLHPPSWPDGNDVEAIPMRVLETAWRESTTPFEREHTTPFVWSRPERFRIHNVSWETGQDYSRTHRFTIDYPEDYRLIEGVYRALHRDGDCFSLGEILAHLREAPALHAQNERYRGLTYHGSASSESNHGSPT